MFERSWNVGVLQTVFSRVSKVVVRLSVLITGETARAELVARAITGVPGVPPRAL